MKKFLCIMLLLGLMILPGLGFTESGETVHLAKTLYTLGQGEDYQTLLALGTVVMNRVESPWYPDSVNGVLNQPHQFACGTRYDDECYRAARAVMMGERTLAEDVVEYCRIDASEPLSAQTWVETVGGYEFHLQRNR